MSSKPARSAPRTNDPMRFDDHLPVRLYRTAIVLEEVARLLLGEAHGLGFTDLRILSYLRERSGASLADTSRDLDIDKAWISRSMKALAARKLVVKQPAPEDSRAIVLSLTRAGAAIYEKALSDATQYNDSILEGVDETRAIEVIFRLEANLRKTVKQLKHRQTAAQKRKRQKSR